MKLVVLGLSLSSSWGNGHATTYRGLLKAFAARGHEILFLERDVPWYGGPHRDLPRPEFCRLELYGSLAELEHHAASVRGADAVLVGSYVPDGIEVARWVQRVARGVVAFYDIDTPVTLAALARGECAYLSPELIAGFAAYLSFTGGPTLGLIEERYGARMARALYCSVDPEFYAPLERAKRWDLSYLGTYSADRQPVLDRLLVKAARRAPDRRFAVAGPQYPTLIDWPANVERMEHVGPADHAEFYAASRYTLNVTRADMVAAGWSPSVRLFEAASCGTAIVSDVWPGLDSLFVPGREIHLARGASDVEALLARPAAEAAETGRAGRARVLAGHTGPYRAAELERYLREAGAPCPSRPVAAPIEALA